LLSNSPRNELTGSWIDWYLAGRINKSEGLNSLRIRTNRLRSSVGLDNLLHGIDRLNFDVQSKGGILTERFG